MRNVNGTFKKGFSGPALKHGELRGGGRTKEYRAWKHMKGRCLTKTDSKFKDYGGRGIAIADCWVNDFSRFLDDVGRAPSRAHSIGRIDNNGNYEPGNVRWETPTQQANNRRRQLWLTHNGKTQTAAQWSRETGIYYETIRARVLYYGYSHEKALTK
jgi:hypothetical protein